MGIKEMAYMRVFGLKMTEEELNQSEHRKIIDDATATVATYTGLYDKETPADRDRRLEIESALYGESVELADYLRTLYPDKYSNKTAWDIVFQQLKDTSDVTISEVAKEHQGVGNDNEDATVGGAKEVSSENVDLPINTKRDDIPTKKEEETKMPETNNLGAALQNLQNSGALNNQSAGTQKPVVDDALQKQAEEAARQCINSEHAQRLAYTKGSKATRGIAMQPSLKKRAIAGGKVCIVKDGSKATAEAKWEKIYANFCEKTGRRKSEAGVIVYDNVRADSIEAAAVLDAWLVERKNDPLGAIELAELSDAEQLKGAYVTTPDSPDETAMNTKELLQLLLVKCFGRLSTSVPESQYVLRKAGSNQAATGTQGSGAASTAKDPWKGVAIVALIKRTEFVKGGVAYAYNITDKGDHVMCSARVKLPGKVYYRRPQSATAENAAEKYSLFSVTAFVECSPTVLDPNLSKFQKKESGVGGIGGVALDFNKEEDVEQMTKQFEAVVASYLVANGGQVPEGGAELFQKAAGMMQSAKAEEVAKETEQMGKIDV